VEGLVDSTSGFSGVTDNLGGTEKNGAVFTQVTVGVNDRTTVSLGARGDFWRSDPVQATDPEHSSNFFSPRAAVAFRVRDDVSLQASAYRSWRSPTLNELYRGFRVGAVTTNANALLAPERLTGVEGGVVFTRGDVSARVTGFFNHLDDAVANVTTAVNTRQRQNASQIRAAGVEIEADVRPHPAVSVRAFAAFTSSKFRSSEQLPALDGNRVPQVAQWQLGGTFTYADPQYLTTSVQVRGMGDQFDDDLNQFRLGAFGVVDVLVSRTLTHGVNAFFAAENLFDKQYNVRTNPLTVGWPQTFRAGVRVFFP
jgi:outer membrane receptor protein involved in Fe transport